jgi:hypothetical protein
MRELLAVAGRLVVIMRKETEALRSAALGAVPALIAEKGELVQRYAGLVKSFGADAETAGALTEAVRDELRETFAAFDAAARENERALSAAREANERVLRAVIEAAETQRPRAQGYGRNGMSAAAPRSGGGISVAIDRSF